MCGRSAKLAALLCLAGLAPLPAHAKAKNFDTVSNFGLGLTGGLEKNPSTDFLPNPQAKAASFSHFFALEPYWDIVNFSLHLVGSYHFYPNASGSGSDGTGGAFRETSAGGSMDYGLRMLLAPFVSHDQLSRAYLTFGMMESTTKLKNSRSYNGGTPNVERVKGHSVDLMAGLGVEEFLMQNYSVQLEAGYIRRNVNSFVYEGSTSASGSAVTAGAQATDSNGSTERLNVRGGYASLAFALHF